MLNVLVEGGVKRGVGQGCGKVCAWLILNPRKKVAFED
jgi:hypothetical protein